MTSSTSRLRALGHAWSLKPGVGDRNVWVQAARRPGHGVHGDRCRLVQAVDFTVGADQIVDPVRLRFVHIGGLWIVLTEEPGLVGGTTMVISFKIAGPIEVPEAQVAEVEHG